MPDRFRFSLEEFNLQILLIQEDAFTLARDLLKDELLAADVV